MMERGLLVKPRVRSGGQLRQQGGIFTQSLSEVDTGAERIGERARKREERELTFAERAKTVAGRRLIRMADVSKLVVGFE